jgi:hypothetical protein
MILAGIPPTGGRLTAENLRAHSGDVLANVVAVLFLPLVVVVARLVMNARRGRVVVLARPEPCSMDEAHHALDRLVAAGISAQIVESDDNGLNMWANTRAAGSVTPQERYVIQVPRDQVAAANLV